MGQLVCEQELQRRHGSGQIQLALRLAGEVNAVRNRPGGKDHSIAWIGLASELRVGLDDEVESVLLRAVWKGVGCTM